jgi:Metalloenzyme superfamily
MTQRSHITPSHRLGQESILVPSPKVATYDLQPEMSAPELTNRAVAVIKSAHYDLIILNYANPNMVGHTGSLPAAIKAVKTVDAGLGRIAEAVREVRGVLLVTTDYGNCEVMRDPDDPDTGEPHTAHTTNPMPVLLAGVEGVELAAGRLADDRSKAEEDEASGPKATGFALTLDAARCRARLTPSLGLTGPETLISESPAHTAAPRAENGRTL